MKLNISTTFFTTLFLLSATLTISHLPSTTAEFVYDTDGTIEYIYDTDGKPMLNGGDYYVMPVIHDSGGVTLATTGNESCPVSVVLSSDLRSRGSAVRIWSLLRVPNIYEGLSLVVSFASSTPECAPAHVIWSVVRDPQDILWIKLRGLDEYGADDSIVPGWWSLGKTGGGRYGDSNIVRFCPEGRKRCEDVVVRVDENGLRSLVVGSSSHDLDEKKNVFAVRFLRARRRHHDDHLRMVHDDA